MLLYLYGRDTGYAREIARYYGSDLDPIQRQLARLELGGVVAAKTAGRTRVYSLNPRYPFLQQLKALLERALQFMDETERTRLMDARRRPRRSGKPL
ncbi:MAG: winged helix-turn-helix domain-containing protein [Candidatus Edwardsbacteria bacterium]|nr:winged helix-turn-helix domain-containing protein [Candidatus Edwardsbacteria bacterium]